MIYKKYAVKLSFIFIAILSCFAVSPGELTWGLSACQGDRKTMEDTHVHITKNNSGFWGLYDGHGGIEAAFIAAQYLHKHFSSILGTIEERLIYAFLQTDCEIIKKTYAGTCAVVAYIKNNDLYFAWAGDSRGILSRNGKIIFATKDHKPDDSGEQKRITDAGSLVIYPNVARIWLPGCKNLLAVSRGLGDKSIKETNENVLIAMPDIHHEKIEPGDILILACDGIWDVLSNQEALRIVNNALNQSTEELEKRNAPFLTLRKKGTTDFNALENGDPKMRLVARTLRNTAYEKGSLDNLSALIVKFK